MLLLSAKIEAEEEAIRDETVEIKYEAALPERMRVARLPGRSVSPWARGL